MKETNSETMEVPKVPEIEEEVPTAPSQSAPWISRQGFTDSVQELRASSTVFSAWLGRFIFHRPLKVIIVSILLTALLGIGLGWLEQTGGGWSLYQVNNSRARRDLAVTQSVFPAPTTEFTVIATPVDGADGEGEDVTRAATFISFNRLRTALVNLTVIHNNFPYSLVSDGVCFRFTYPYNDTEYNSPCHILSVLDLWQNSDDSITASPSIHTDLSKGVVRDSLGRPFPLSYVVGGVKLSADGKRVLAGSALRMVFRLKDGQGNPSNLASYAWAQAAKELVRNFPSPSLKFFASSPFDSPKTPSKLSELDWRDVVLVCLGALLVLGVGVAGPAGLLSFRTTLILMFANVCTVMVCITSTLGLTSFLGLKSSPVTVIVMLVLVVISLDNFFLSATSLAQPLGGHTTTVVSDGRGALNTFVALSAVTGRVSFAWSFTAASVLCTGAAMSSIPLVRYALFQATAGVLLLMFFQWTFFAPCVAMCLKRRMSSGEFLCRLPLKSCMETCSPGSPRAQHRSRFVQVLTHPIGMVTITVLTVSLLIPGMVGVARIEPKFDSDLLLSDRALDASTREMRRLNQRFFPRDSHPLVVVLSDYKPHNPFTSDRQRIEVTSKMTALNGSLKNVSNIHGETLNSWYSDFMIATPNATLISGYDFFTLLQLYVMQEWRYFGDLRFFTRTPEMAVFLTTSRISFFLKNVNTKKTQDQAMRNLQSLADKSWPSRSTTVSSSSFPSWEGQAVISNETRSSLLVSIGVVLVCLIFFTMDFITSVVSCIALIAVVVNTWGFLYFWSWDHDPVVTILLFLAGALSLSSMQSFAVTFLSVGGVSQQERLQLSLKHSGHMALNGAIALFLGAIPFAGSDSYIFAVSSQALLTIAVLRVWHSLLFLPMFLGLFLPVGYKYSDELPSGSKQTTSDNDLSVKQSAAPSNDGSNSGNDGISHGLSLKFRPLPRIAPFVTIPEDEVLEGNPTIAMPSIDE